MSDEFAVQTFNLTRLFNSLVAVDGINLNIKKGELFAMLGPNGAGKTTTISMLCCLLKPTRGTATVLGYDVNKEPYEVKRVIGVAPQETVISERLNSLENIELIGRIHGMGARELNVRARELLETMGLNERAKDQVRKFSGGMKRRLNIIMALVHNPEVLFLDEPSLGLDPQARRAVWDYIMKLKGRRTILLTTHYMDEADFLADRIGIMNRAKIVALGTTSELKYGAFKKQTMVITVSNLSHQALYEVRSRYGLVEVTDGSIAVTGENLDFKEIVDRFHASGAIIRSAYVKEPTLEDVFLQITGRELRE